MALKDLSDLDFTYYKDYAKKMRDCHEKEFMEVIDPALMRAFYRGKNKKQSTNNSYNVNEHNREHFLTLSRIFQATNTILPNLYYQNPRIMASAIKMGDPRDGALMTAALNHYMVENKQKQENQEAVMNTWFFGLGWKKQGYRTVFYPETQDVESVSSTNQGFMNQVKSMVGMGPKPDSNESKERPEIVDYEGPFNSSESPLNVMTDHKASLRQRRAVLHRVPRTLYDLKNFGNYDKQLLKDIEEKQQYKHGSRLSDREIDLTLNEFHVKHRGGLWILAWVDEHNAALRYDASTAEGCGDGWEPLTFTNEPDVRYPISHMKVATQVQEHIDYLATLYIKILDRVRNQIMLNEQVLAPGQKKAVEANKLGGIIWAKKAITSTDFAQITSSPVSSDLPFLLQALGQNATEILGTDEQTVSGKSTNKTLGQDQMANVGTQIRESGMLDKVRDWMIAQAKTEGKLLQTYSDAELELEVTPKDFPINTPTVPTEPYVAEFMTQNNPMGLKSKLKGKTFNYNINIFEAIKPDTQTLRQSYMEMLNVSSAPAVQDALLQRGKAIRTDLIAEEAMKNFDGVDNPERFIEQLDSRQVAAIQASKVLMQSGGVVPQPPKEEKPDKKGVAA